MAKNIHTIQELLKAVNVLQMQEVFQMSDDCQNFGERQAYINGSNAVMSRVASIAHLIDIKEPGNG